MVRRRSYIKVDKYICPECGYRGQILVERVSRRAKGLPPKFRLLSIVFLLCYGIAYWIPSDSISGEGSIIWRVGTIFLYVICVSLYWMYWKKTRVGVCPKCKHYPCALLKGEFFRD